MRIAVDARELHGHPTGVGRFLRELLSAWERLPEASAHQFIRCAPGDGEEAGTLWEQFTLPRLVHDAGADVLFAPGYTAPLRIDVPVVLAIHDVSFAAHPEWFSWHEGARRRTITRLAAERARRVITISEFSKREITAHLGIEPSKIAVVYPGLTQVAPGSTTALRNSVLYVGSIFKRRHVPELIDGFARVALTHPDLHLDIVGDNRTSPPIDLDDVVDASGAGARIHLRSYVDDAELNALYGRASAFVFLSDYEGFGLTPLEALGAGVPIVVLDTAVAREVYGDAAVYVARPSPTLIAEALEQVVSDTPIRQRVLAAAPQVLARYSWDAAARRILGLLTR